MALSEVCTTAAGYKAVRIAWEDSEYYGQGWRTKDDVLGWAQKPAIECVSVGLLVALTPNAAVLALSEGVDGDLGDCLKIPRSAIFSISYLDDGKLEIERERKKVA